MNFRLNKSYKLAYVLVLMLALLLFPSTRLHAQGVVEYAGVIEGGAVSETVSDGATCGTVGQSKSLVGLKAQTSLEMSEIEYQTHLSDVGWTDYVSGGALSGLPDGSKKIEAFRARLTGEAAGTHELYYRAHVSNIGWLDWAKGGDVAGTTGYAEHVEALEMMALPKGSPAPGPTECPNRQKGVPGAADAVVYAACLSAGGWQPETANGASAGTVGQGLPVCALKARLRNADGEIQYNVHMENLGWLKPAKDGAALGDETGGLRMEALQFVLAGDAASVYDVYYRTHISDYGWLGWAKNGENAGSVGGSKAIEAFEIQLVPKGGAAPGSTENAFLDLGRPVLPAPSNSGALQVRNGRLVSEGGTPVQLKGVSTHGIGWFPDYVNQQLFSELKNNWNANAVRLAMYSAEYNGYCTGGDKAALRDLVKRGVDYATQADMYAIVDWHILSDGDPNTHKQEAAEFFSQISSELSGHNNVIYEICNEPNGSATWDGIKGYASEIIPVIRANDADAIIVVGTPTWSQRVDEALASPIQGFDNLMYAFHFYAGTHKGDLRSVLTRSVEGGLPVFVTEFGISDASGNGSLDVASGNEWMAEINRLGLSYTCWNLSNKAEASALIRSDCAKTSGFGQEDLSPHGQWLLGILSSPGLVASTPATGPETQPPVTPSVNGGAGNLSCRIELVNSWESGSESFYQYSLSLTNTSSEAVDSWRIGLKFDQTIGLEGSWNGVFSKEADRLAIVNMDYNNRIEPGAAVGDIGFIVRSGKNLNVSVED